MPAPTVGTPERVGILTGDVERDLARTVTEGTAGLPGDRIGEVIREAMIVKVSRQE